MRYLTLCSAGQCYLDCVLQERVILWIDCPEVDNQAALSNVADDRGISVAQSVQKVRVSWQGERFSCNRSLGSGAATHKSLRPNDLRPQPLGHALQAAPMRRAVDPESIQGQGTLRKVTAQHRFQ